MSWRESTEESATICTASSPAGDAFVEVRVIEENGDSFEATSTGAAALTAANSGFAFKIDSEEPIDVEGAAEAAFYTFGQNENSTVEAGTRYGNFTEADGGDFVLLGTGVDPGSGFDPRPIAESLRIG